MSNGAALSLLAVDDERSQLEDLARLLDSSPAVGEVVCASDGRAALVEASARAFDAIFLDVRMPDLDGLELARVLRRFARPPQLVFVTAHEGPAVEAFELRAIDYLLKPVSRRRVLETLERIVQAAEADGGPETTVDAEVIAVANLRTGSTRLLPRSSILYCQSHGDFVRVVADEGRYLIRATLADIERRWEGFGFVRVHRQYVGNLRKAVEMRPQLGGTAELVFPGGQTIPISRRHVVELGRRLGV